MTKHDKTAGFTLLLLLASFSPKLSAQEGGVTANVRISETASAAHTKRISSANVVLWLTPLDRPLPAPAPKQHVRLIQKNKEFSPHLLVIPIGTSVDFPNLDPFFHNVFSLFNGRRFDLGLYEAGSHRSVSFDREGVSYIFCNIHPEMGAVVVSLKSPYYAISSPDGSIVVHDVPPGRYRVQTWAEQLQPVSMDGTEQIVQVTAKGASLGALTFVAGVDPLAHHKNKFGKDYSSPQAPQY
jgi:plastocyanin